jgi:hypothetical protein
MTAPDTEAASPGTVSVSAEPPRTVWEFFVRAWRPSASWVLVIILAVRGAILPLLQWRAGQAVEQLDWVSIVALVGVLGLGALRSHDLKQGIA